MIEIISIILSFVIGGGLTAIFTLKYTKKTSKVDMADKIIAFYEKKIDDIMHDYNELKREVEELRLQMLRIDVCTRENCKLRIK